MALLAFLALTACAIRIGGSEMEQEEKTLRSLAESRDFLIGTCVRNPLQILREEPLYAEVLAREFNVVVPENCMKFGPLCRERGVYDFSAADAMVEFAEEHGMAVRGHASAWHIQNPKWLMEGTWTREELVEILRDHIREVVGRYKGRIFAWDVVNEHHAWGSGKPWKKGIGDEYIDMAFRWYHEVDPDALLFYNDYGIGLGGAKFEKVFAMVEGLLDRGVPIHGVGFQMHIGLGTEQIERLRDSIRRVGALGLQVHITELDVAIPKPVTEEKLQRQAEIYRQVAEIALSEPACTALLMWGFTDKHSWIPMFSKGRNGAALVFDEEYQAKPAYEALRDALEQELP